MESQPKFLKDFSKEVSQEDRDKTAQEIRAKRKEHFAIQDDRKTEAGQVGEKQEEFKNDLERVERELNKLSKILEELNSNRLSQITNFLKIRAVRQKLGQAETEKRGLEDSIAQANYRQEQLQNSLASKEGYSEVELTLQSFYDKQKVRWSEAGFDKEKAKELFTEEHLASLSIEEYKLLLERFSKRVMTHVFGFGVRDHSGMIEHQNGVGKYDGGVLNMLKDGRLRSSLGKTLVEENKKAVVADYLRLSEKDRGTAKQLVDDFVGYKTEQGHPASYADFMAVHFAGEEVADAYYGGETGNEIFVIYPTEMIASQYYFHGDTDGGDTPGNQYNDTWVWANEEKGLSLDAGIVFIPADTQVDIVTGSKYEVGDNGDVLLNTDMVSRVRNALSNEKFLQNYKSYLSDLGRLKGGKDTELYIENNLNEIKETLGVDDDVARVVMSYSFLGTVDLWRSGVTTDWDMDTTMDAQLLRKGVKFLKANNTVSSRDFWEKHFRDNPDSRPSKVVYYEGGNPTDAVNRWLGHGKKRGIDLDVEFAENKVAKNSPEAKSGVDRFASLAREVIDEYYDDKERAETSNKSI